MKVSELIKLLQVAKAQYGDLEVYGPWPIVAAIHDREGDKEFIRIHG